jgi:nitrogen regulatory protein P-II 1
MKKVEAVIKPFKLDDVKEGLSTLGVKGLTVTEVRGFGRQRGHREVYRGAEYQVDFVSKIKIEVVMEDGLVADAVRVIQEKARTGQIREKEDIHYPMGTPFESEQARQERCDIRLGDQTLCGNRRSRWCRVRVLWKNQSSWTKIPMTAPYAELLKERADLTSLFSTGEVSTLFHDHYTEIMDQYFRRSHQESDAGRELFKNKNPFAVIALGLCRKISAFL